MTTESAPGPMWLYGAVPIPSGMLPIEQATTNPDRGPSGFDQGLALPDPRPFLGWEGPDSPHTGFYMGGGLVLVDQAPSQLQTNNIAASQAGTSGVALTLVSSSAAGITVGTSISQAITGATITGLLAIDGAAAYVAFGASANILILDPTKAISRTVRLSSTDNTHTVTVAGYDVYGFPMTETHSLNGTVTAGKKAFKYIASVTPNGTLTANVSVGTGDIFGFPIRCDTFGYSTFYFNDTIGNVNGFVAAVTTAATATTGDVRGTIDITNASGFNTSSNGTKKLQLFMEVSPANASTTAGLFGVAQF